VFSVRYEHHLHIKKQSSQWRPTDVFPAKCEHHLQTIKLSYPRNRPWRSIDVRFEVFTAVTMKNAVFRDVTLHGSCMNTLFLRSVRRLLVTATFLVHRFLSPR
jgi:hypothetical protein